MKKAMRKNGLATRLSGTGVGSVKKDLIEAILNGTGVTKYEAVQIMTAFNILLSQILKAGGQKEDKYQIPENAVIPV
jgi:hypothetical protein